MPREAVDLDVDQARRDPRQIEDVLLVRRDLLEDVVLDLHVADLAGSVRAVIFMLPPSAVRA